MATGRGVVQQGKRIPSLGWRSVEQILAETGFDMRRFPGHRMNAGSTAITGYGDQSCTPGPLTVEIDLYMQHQQWWGGWTTDAGPIYAGANGNSYLFQNIAYICPSGSVQTYRIVNQGWAQDVDGTWYTASVQSGNYLTVKC